MATQQESFEKVIQRLEIATSQLEKLAKTAVAVGAGAAVEEEGSSKSVQAYKELIANELYQFIAKSTLVGGVVEQQAGLVKMAFDEQLRLISLASVSKKPANIAFLITGLQGILGQITALVDKERRSALFSHLTCVADGIGALGWVVVVSP